MTIFEFFFLARRQSRHDAQVRHLRTHGRHGVLAEDSVGHGWHYSVSYVSVFRDHRLRRTSKRLVSLHSLLREASYEHLKSYSNKFTILKCSQCTIASKLKYWEQN